MDARLARQEERFTELQRQNQALLAAMQGLRPPPPKQEPPPPPPDFFDNPDAAFEYRIKQVLEPLHAQRQAEREADSVDRAIEKFGVETVQQAYTALAERVQQVGPQDPSYARIMQARHPYGELVKWHREQTALTRYGADPQAYIEQEVQRRIAEMQGQQPQQAARPSSPQSYPSNMTQGRPSAGPRNTPGMNGPLPLSQIMGR
jgi:hypothetical protein